MSHASETLWARCERAAEAGDLPGFWRLVAEWIRENGTRSRQMTLIHDQAVRTAAVLEKTEAA
jgi:hypothetical protein